MNRNGASGAAVAGILIFVIIIIVLLYSVNSGVLKLGKSASAKPAVFSVSASINSSSIYEGKSAPMYLVFFNPFNESVNVQFQSSVGAPAYVSISPKNKAIDMPADMTGSSTVLFNVSCLASSSGISSTYLFSADITDFWQNITTSAVVYPYGTAASLIPSALYNNLNQGMMAISASPVSIETQIPGGPLSTTMHIDISPSFDSGMPYTSLPVDSQTSQIKSINIMITNSSGIASASLFYDGQTYPFTVSGNKLVLSLPNVNMALISSGLPVTINALNSNSTSQNVISINVNYNYYFTFNGSPSQISCT